MGGRAGDGRENGEEGRRGELWGGDDLRKIFTEGSQMAKVPNGVETLPKISIA